MKGFVTVETPEEFGAWIAAQEAEVAAEHAPPAPAAPAPAADTTPTNPPNTVTPAAAGQEAKSTS